MVAGSAQRINDEEGQLSILPFGRWVFSFRQPAVNSAINAVPEVHSRSAHGGQLTRGSSKQVNDRAVQSRIHSAEGWPTPVAGATASVEHPTKPGLRGVSTTWPSLPRLRQSPVRFVNDDTAQKNAHVLGWPKDKTYPSASLISNPRKPSWVSLSGSENSTLRDENSAASASGSETLMYASQRAPGSRWGIRKRIHADILEHDHRGAPLDNAEEDVVRGPLKGNVKSAPVAIKRQCGGNIPDNEEWRNARDSCFRHVIVPP